MTKPTEAMIEAFYKAYDASHEMQPREHHQAVYDGLAAALSALPPQAPEGAVKALTYDDVEEIIEKTEPPYLSDKGDRIWTRRMAVALADIFNSRILSALESSAPVKGETEGWRPIETAPKDKTPVIIAVPTKDRDDWIVGEAYFDPESYEGGDWWWAGTSHGDYTSSPISDCNHHAPEFWRQMPAPPNQGVEK